MQQTEKPGQQQQPSFRRIWRKHGIENVGYATCHSATELLPWGNAENDLELIVSPHDGSLAAKPLVHSLPLEFRIERAQSVTHAFGHELGENGRETLWMRFLAGVAKVEAPNEQPEWVKWSCALTWLPKAASCDPVTTQPRTYSVAMIVFAPPREVFRSLGEFIKSPKWTDATVDPYVLADIVLLSWYHHVDQLAWGVTKLVRNEEKDVFEGTRCLLSDESSVQDIDLHRLHTSAKNSLFMLEALDAAVRVAEAAISAHEPLRQHGRIVPENTHRRLRHRLELFHSTRLRMLSCQARIKNTVDLAFHINTARDSRSNIKNSRSMRTIAIVGLVFIPFGTITSVFGSQFFTPRASGAHMDVNPDIWILFAIALPVTIISLAIWIAAERRDNQKHDDNSSKTPGPSHEHTHTNNATSTSHESGHGINSETSLLHIHNYPMRFLELVSGLGSVARSVTTSSGRLTRWGAAATRLRRRRAKPVDDLNAAELGSLPPHAG